jgi:hypothetical protein
MIFKYLKKVENNKKIGFDKIKGVKESEILKVEKRLKIKFPLAYKEFLLLAGDYPGNLQLADGATSLEQLSKENYIAYMNKALLTANLKIERPFWVISEQDGFQQFYFFYLDEETENPMVYGVTYGNSDDTSIIYPLNETFSEFIDTVIDKSILFAKRGY